MKKNINLIIFFVIIVVGANGSVIQNSSSLDNVTTIQQTAHISPEIINELKDFENLIPEATVDELIAKHYLFDKSFRTALNYLRSEEFSQLQKQLLNVPEIIEILEFLHLTAANATTRHMGATKIPTKARLKASLDEYNDGDVNDDDAVAFADFDNRDEKITTNTGTHSIISKSISMAAETAKEVISDKKVPKGPQQQYHNGNRIAGVDNSDAAAANANSFATLSSNGQQISVGIALLEDLEVKAKLHNRGYHNHYYKYQRQCSNHYGRSLGAFTEFVEEILQHLPNSAYQNMIKDKCKENAQFAEFYHALRSKEFKTVIEQAKTTANIKKIIQTLGSYQVDVNSLEPVAFKLISWGPNI